MRFENWIGGKPGITRWVLCAAPRTGRLRRRRVFFSALILGVTLSGAVGCAGWIPHPGVETQSAAGTADSDLGTLAFQPQQSSPGYENPSSPTAAAGGGSISLSATDTPAPGNTVLPASPTETAIGSLPVLPAEVRFRTGGTMAVVQKQIHGGERHTYTLRALKGQTMILSLSSGYQDVFLGLEGVEDGQTLLPLSGASTSASVVLPETQDYKITVYASQTDNVYTLRIEIPSEIEAAPGQGPVVVDGRIDLLELSSPYETRVRYLIDVEKGRRLKVKLDMPDSDDFTLALYGQEDGQPYLKNVQADSIDLEVPTTQGYYLDVHSGTSSTFTLVVEVD